MAHCLETMELRQSFGGDTASDEKLLVLVRCQNLKQARSVALAPVVGSSAASDKVLVPRPRKK